MDIKTKFDIGDIVYFLDENKICKKPIGDIKSDTSEHQGMIVTSIKYIIYDPHNVQIIGRSLGTVIYVEVPEDNLFSSPDDLYEDLTNNLESK